MCSTSTKQAAFRWSLPCMQIYPEQVRLNSGRAFSGKMFTVKLSSLFQLCMQGKCKLILIRTGVPLSSPLFVRFMTGFFIINTTIPKSVLSIISFIFLMFLLMMRNDVLQKKKTANHSFCGVIIVSSSCLNFVNSSLLTLLEEMKD